MRTILLFILLSLASCVATPQPLPLCVITGKDATNGPTAVYRGETVNFCCTGCEAKWLGMDDATKEAALAKRVK
jgi:hypothetical protein